MDTDFGYVQAVEVSRSRLLNQFRVGIIGDDIDCTRGINPKDTNLRLECRKAYEALVSILKPAVAINPVDCDALFSFVQEEDNFGWDENGQWAGLREDLAVMYEMADNVDTYLGQREDCALETLEDLAKWNDDHSVGRRCGPLLVAVEYHSQPDKPDGSVSSFAYRLARPSNLASRSGASSSCGPQAIPRHLI